MCRDMQNVDEHGLEMLVTDTTGQTVPFQQPIFMADLFAF